MEAGSVQNTSLCKRVECRQKRNFTGKRKALSIFIVVIIGHRFFSNSKRKENDKNQMTFRMFLLLFLIQFCWYSSFSISTSSFPSQYSWLLFIINTVFVSSVHRTCVSYLCTCYGGTISDILVLYPLSLGTKVS